jgi:hypothetical protein
MVCLAEGIENVEPARASAYTIYWKGIPLCLGPKAAVPVYKTPSLAGKGFGSRQHVPHVRHLPVAASRRSDAAAI